MSLEDKKVEYHTLHQKVLLIMSQFIMLKLCILKVYDLGPYTHCHCRFKFSCLTDKTFFYTNVRSWNRFHFNMSVSISGQIADDVCLLLRLNIVT